MRTREFEMRLLEGILADCHVFQENNVDFFRLGAKLTQQIRRRVVDKLFSFARGLGMVRRHFSREKATKELRFCLAHAEEFERTFELLEDERSRQWLVDLFKYRILGPRHVRLTTNNESYWRKHSQVTSEHLRKSRTVKTVWNWWLDRYVISTMERRIELNCLALNVLNTFLLEQYALRRDGATILARPGDIVIDAGGCWGDTALYFADQVGPKGTVYSFEFVPANLDVFKQNVPLNEELARRITIVPNAVWSVSNAQVPYSENGPCTSLGEGETKPLRQVSTVAIDDFVTREKLPKLDFVKMDIEGSELEALRGAERTLERFRPKLAIALYHHPEDFLTIPSYLAGLGLGYRFFLDHVTIWEEETMLFCTVG